MNKVVIYMEVTRDKYELPIAVASNLRELSRLTHVPYGTICTYISKQLGRFYKIVIPADMCDD